MRQSPEPHSGISSQKKTPNSSVALLPPAQKDTHLWRQTEPKRDAAVLVRVHLQGLLPAHGAGQSQMVPMCAQHTHEGLTARQSNTPWPLLQPLQCHRPTQTHTGCAPKLPALGNSFYPFLPENMQIQKGSLSSKKAALASVVRALPTTWKKWKSELSSCVLGFSTRRCQIDRSLSTMKKETLAYL